MTTSEKLTAFVGQSFSKQDENVNRQIRDFLKSADIDWETGEESENRQVSIKVRERIDAHSLFVGILTRRLPIEPPNASAGYFIGRLFGGGPAKSFSTSAWVLQESGYALAKGKRLIFIVEDGVDFPELQGDLEYVALHRFDLSKTFQKLNEVLSSIRRLEASSIGEESAPRAASPPDIQPETGFPISTRRAVTASGEDERPDPKEEAFGALGKALFLEPDLLSITKYSDISGTFWYALVHGQSSRGQAGL